MQLKLPGAYHTQYIEIENTFSCRRAGETAI